MGGGPASDDDEYDGHRVDSPGAAAHPPARAAPTRAPLPSPAGSSEEEECVDSPYSGSGGIGRSQAKLGPDTPVLTAAMASGAIGAIAGSVLGFGAVWGSALGSSIGAYAASREDGDGARKFGQDSYNVVKNFAESETGGRVRSAATQTVEMVKNLDERLGVTYKVGEIANEVRHTEPVSRVEERLDELGVLKDPLGATLRARDELSAAMQEATRRHDLSKLEQAYSALKSNLVALDDRLGVTDAVSRTKSKVWQEYRSLRSTDEAESDRDR